MGDLSKVQIFYRDLLTSYPDHFGEERSCPNRVDFRPCRVTVDG